MCVSSQARGAISKAEALTVSEPVQVCTYLETTSLSFVFVPNRVLALLASCVIQTQRRVAIVQLQTARKSKNCWHHALQRTTQESFGLTFALTRKEATIEIE